MTETQTPYYSLEIGKIIDNLNSNPDNGLSSEEAQKRLEKYGPNEIPKISKGFIQIYLAPLFNWLIVIYLFGAILLYIGAMLENEKPPNTIYIVLGIVLLNCLIAIYQQFKATKKLEALRELSAPTSTIIRDGQKMEVPTSNLVIGDILVLDQGDKVPADARIINSVNLEVNEASLTGESALVKKMEEGNAIMSKNLPISEMANMVFFGTYIAIGNATTIVVKTGADTEIGKISKGLEEAGTSKIPIREKMNNFGKWLGILVSIVWVISLIVFFFIRGKIEIVASLNAAMDLMPINLPLLAAIILFTGVLAMAQEGVIVRNIASVDSLGRISIVCTDKTGTLTQNQMSVQYIWVNDQLFKVTGVGYKPEGNIINIHDPKNHIQVSNIEDYPNLKLLIKAGYLNNNASLVKNEIEEEDSTTKDSSYWNVLGSPTEGALMVLFHKAMKNYSLDDYELIREFPFTSSMKRMSKVYKKDENFYSFTKGASEVILPLCSRIIINDTERELTDELREKVLSKIFEFANQGYRILSLTYKKLGEQDTITEDDREECESHMTYLGFVMIFDPPREGVKESVEECYKAGVEVVMITGDSSVTAKSIAEQISIIDDQDELAIEGNDIDKYSNNDDFNKIKVFARVSPTHKETIVKRYQSEKRVVAMTGDGVNDALALNLADAGISMGITGTDVAKEASDMVISDDSFNSIVTGIRQGRLIFSNIRSIVFFYIAINVFLGIVGFIISVVLDLPFWVDPYSDFFPLWIFLSITVKAFLGLALTFDTVSEDIMDEKPRDSEEILSKNILRLMLIFGVLYAISICITYFICMTGVYGYEANTNLGIWNEAFLYTDQTAHLTKGIDYNQAKAFTMLMSVLFVCITFMVFQIRRPNKSLIESLKERDFNYVMVIFVVLTWFSLLALIYIPGTQVTITEWAQTSDFWKTFDFKFMFLTPIDWLVIFAISSITIIGLELAKYYARLKGISF